MKLIDVFFPPVCPICHGHAGENVLCGLCESIMKEKEVLSEKYLSVDGKGVRAFYLYNYGSKEFERYVFALKKRAGKALIRDASCKLLKAVPEGIVDCKTVITNIPRRKSNVREYGYDQSQRIAKELSKMLGVRYEKLILRRGFSKEQKDLDAKQRRRNVSGKFRAVCKSNAKRIIVVDDVLTTGNSFSECVRVLRTVYGNSVEIVGLFLASRNYGSDI